jgi:quaternary ammonium compound-resistance protein SugE
MQLLELTLASVCFAAGGVFMKWSEGATRPWPSAAFFGLFLAGAALQAIAMRETGLGVAYIFVLGLEALLAFVFSAFLFQERWPASRVVAVVLIVAGIALLRRS